MVLIAYPQSCSRAEGVPERPSASLDLGPAPLGAAVLGALALPAPPRRALARQLVARRVGHIGVEHGSTTEPPRRNLEQRVTESCPC